MSHRYVPLGILCSLLITFSSCTEKTSLPSETLRTSACADLSGEAITYGIFYPTLQLWGESFLRMYKVGSQDSLFSFVIPYEDLDSAMNVVPGCQDSCYQGLRVYLGLDSAVSSISEIQNHLCLLVVPYRETGGVSYDTIFSGPLKPVIKIGRGSGSVGTPVGISKGQAQAYIDHWQNHYEIDEDFMVPISSFMLPASIIYDYLDTMANDPNINNGLYLTLGYHTLEPTDTIHCVENAKAQQDSSLANVYGYGTLTLMLSLVSNFYSFDESLRSDDFVRPCPRFCGVSLFNLKFSSDNTTTP